MKTTKPCETNIDINGDKSMTKVLKSLLKTGWNLSQEDAPDEKKEEKILPKNDECYYDVSKDVSA